MVDGSPRVEIRSYRAVFDLERRIYRIDRLRLNPSGVPLRGIAYALIIGAVVLVASRLPVVGWALGVLPWHVRDFALPIGLAAMATMVRVDGRALHVAARALADHAFSPRRVARFAPCHEPDTWRPPELVVIPDGSQPGFRRARFTGPGAVLVRRAHTRSTKTSRIGVPLAGADLTLIEDGRTRGLAKGEVVLLNEGARLEIRPADRGGRR